MNSYKHTKVNTAKLVLNCTATSNMPQCGLVCIIVLSIISKLSPTCLGRVKPVEISYNIRNQISKCLPYSHDHLQPAEVFERCKEAVEESLTWNDKHPDQGKTVAEMTARQGYPLETYEIFTEDGYILTLFRIPGGPKNPPKRGKRAVLLQHGMMQCSESWFTLEGDRGLALKLVNQGFDVFLGNSRGSKYSLGHKSLNSTEDISYWNFSWHEKGFYDVPANINEILKITGLQKIYYVGFSMGTTQFFVAMSERPEFNDKIKAAVLLSPVAYMGHSDSPIKFATPVVAHPESKNVFGPIFSGRVDKIAQSSEYEELTTEVLCSETAYLCGLCGFIQYFSAGFNPEQTNFTNLPNAFSKTNERISVGTLLHYTQNINSCKFRKYDHGRGKNLELYGTARPPEYQLKKINVPTYLFVGAMDKFAYPVDVNITRNKMRPGVVIKEVLIKKKAWSHFDFISGKDADVLVFNEVVQMLKTHETNKTLQ